MTYYITFSQQKLHAACKIADRAPPPSENTNSSKSKTSGTCAPQMLASVILLTEAGDRFWALECLSQVPVFLYCQSRMLVFTYHTKLYI